MLETIWESRWPPDSQENKERQRCCDLHINKETGNCSNGGVAQLGEHLPCKQGVKSSNLSISTLAMSNAEIERQATLSSLLDKGWMERDFDSAKHVTK